MIPLLANLCLKENEKEFEVGAVQETMQLIWKVEGNRPMI